MVGRTDWSMSSLHAVERALRWYAEEVHLAQNPPLSAAEASDLHAALRGERPLESRQFERLVQFAHTMFLVGRRAPELPTCNLGDALTALGAPLSERTWRWEPRVDADTFAKLRFGEASAGIVKTQRANRAGWDLHARQNRAFIVEAAQSRKKRELAVVLGAGQGFDLPLRELAQSFERLVLIDVDAAALEATVASTIQDAGLRARIELRVLDLTGINGQLVRAVDDIFAVASSEDTAFAQLAELCRSYWLPDFPAILPADTRADLLVSGLVLSQVSWPQRVYALRLYEQRFGKLSAEAEKRWIEPWWELELKIQQDHVASLASSAERAVLCSDVVSRPTQLDASGAERETGRKIFALGVAELAERIPAGFEVERHAAWPWARYRAETSGRPGSRMDVEGLVLKPKFR
jgi:hypothetical protein